MAQHCTSHNDTPYFLKAIYVCHIHNKSTQSNVTEFLSAVFSQYNTLSEVTICCAAPGVANISLARFRTLEQCIRKVKCTLVQALRLCTAHRGNTLSWSRHPKGVRDQRHSSATLYPREGPGTHCTGGLGGPQGRSGQVWKILSPPGFDPRTVQSVAGRYTDYSTWPLEQYMRHYDEVPYCQLHIPISLVCSFS